MACRCCETCSSHAESLHRCNDKITKHTLGVLLEVVHGSVHWNQRCFGMIAVIWRDRSLTINLDLGSQTCYKLGKTVFKKDDICDTYVTDDSRLLVHIYLFLCPIMSTECVVPLATPKVNLWENVWTWRNSLKYLASFTKGISPYLTIGHHHCHSRPLSSI